MSGEVEHDRYQTTYFGGAGDWKIGKMAQDWIGLDGIWGVHAGTTAPSMIGFVNCDGRRSSKVSWAGPPVVGIVFVIR